MTENQQSVAVSTQSENEIPMKERQLERHTGTATHQAWDQQQRREEWAEGQQRRKVTKHTVRGGTPPLYQAESRERESRAVSAEVRESQHMEQHQGR
jgi:hypothetical protein